MIFSGAQVSLLVLVHFRASVSVVLDSSTSLPLLYLTCPNPHSNSMLNRFNALQALKTRITTSKHNSPRTRLIHSTSGFKLLQKDGKSYREVALYVHWPYCKHICPYCDFNRFLMPNGPPGLKSAPTPDIVAQTHRNIHTSMRQALISELRMHLKAYGHGVTPNNWDPQISTSSEFVQPLITSIFFGGGTPSLADVR